MPANFKKNIFVNCPFDDDYRKLLIGIVFTIIYFGYRPRLALESADSGRPRIEKILKLIKESKLGIHDLSRIVSIKRDELHRMNMPFELGVDFGCKNFRNGKWRKKKILILEKERYRFQKAISDLSGCDIKNHDNEVIKVIKAVRNWLVTEELKTGDSDKKVWDEYNLFHGHLYDVIVEKEGHPSIDDIQVSEIIRHMQTWVKRAKRSS